MWLKQSTAASCIVGPILDSTGAEYASAVIGDLSISKNGGTLTALASAATLTYIANGMYTLALTTGNTDTVGRVEISCNKSTYQMPQKNLLVFLPSVFDALITNATNGTGGLIAATAAVSAVAGYVGSSGAAINGTNANTLSSHDPGATLGTSTLTQTQVTGGAYALNSSSFAFNTAMDFTSTQKTSLNAATPAVTVSDKTGFSLTSAYDPAKTASQAGDAMALTSGERTTTAGVIWNSLTSGFLTVGSVGKKLKDWVLGADNKAMLSTDAQTGVVLPRVTLVDTTTTNTDMRGTDNAALAATALSTATWSGTLATNLGTLAGHDPGSTLASASAVSALQTTANAINSTVTLNADTSGTTTLLGRVTSSRAGFWDNLNVGGSVASHADIVNFTQSMPNALVVTSLVYPVESTNKAYPITLYIWNENGQLQDADGGTITSAITNAVGTDRSSNFSGWTHGSTGTYTATYTVTTSATLEPLVMKFSGTTTTNSIASNFVAVTQPQVNADGSVSFSSTDRTNLTAIYNKLPANNIADETLLEAAIGVSTNAGSIGEAVDIAISEANAAHNIVADVTSGNPALYTILDDVSTKIVNNGRGVQAELMGINGHDVAVDTGTAGVVSFVSGDYVMPQGTTVQANVTQINGETAQHDGNGRLGVQVLSGGEGFYDEVKVTLGTWLNRIDMPISESDDAVLARLGTPDGESIAADIAAIGGGSAPTADQIADEVETRSMIIGSWGAGVFEQLAALDHIAIFGSVVRRGLLKLVQGDDYSDDTERLIKFGNSAGSWFNLTGATVTLSIYDVNTLLVAVEGVVAVATGSGQRIDVAMTAVESMLVNVDKAGFRLVAVYPGGDVVTLEEGVVETLLAK